MSWWLKESSLILLICCLAVYAESEGDTASVISEQGAKFLKNPLDLLYSKFTTPKPPKVIVIKPQYLPQYPSQYAPLYTPQYYPTKYPHRPTKSPRPSKRPSKRPQDHHHYHQHHYGSHQVPRPACPPNYAFYSWYNSASTHGHQRNPIGICVPIKLNGNHYYNNGFPISNIVPIESLVPIDDGVPNNNGFPNNNVAPNNVYVPNSNEAPNNNGVPNNNAAANNNGVPNNNAAANNNGVPNNNAAPSDNFAPNSNAAPNNNGVPDNNVAPNNNGVTRNVLRYFVRGPTSSYADNENFDDFQSEIPHEYNDYDYEAHGRSAERDYTTLLTGSNVDNENDEFVINTKDVKLPFVVHLGDQVFMTPSDLDKKINDQETLIYLKNLRKGRKLESNKSI